MQGFIIDVRKSGGITFARFMKRIMKKLQVFESITKINSYIYEAKTTGGMYIDIEAKVILPTQIDDYTRTQVKVPIVNLKTSWCSALDFAGVPQKEKDQCAVETEAPANNSANVDILYLWLKSRQQYLWVKTTLLENGGMVLPRQTSGGRYPHLYALNTVSKTLQRVPISTNYSRLALTKSVQQMIVGLLKLDNNMPIVETEPHRVAHLVVNSYKDRLWLQGNVIAAKWRWLPSTDGSADYPKMFKLDLNEKTIRNVPMSSEIAVILNEDTKQIIRDNLNLGKASVKQAVKEPLPIVPDKDSIYVVVSDYNKSHSLRRHLNKHEFTSKYAKKHGTGYPDYYHIDLKNKTYKLTTNVPREDLYNYDDNRAEILSFITNNKKLTGSIKQEIPAKDDLIYVRVYDRKERKWLADKLCSSAWIAIGAIVKDSDNCYYSFDKKNKTVTAVELNDYDGNYYRVHTKEAKAKVAGMLITAPEEMPETVISITGSQYLKEALINEITDKRNSVKAAVDLNDYYLYFDGKSFNAGYTPKGLVYDLPSEYNAAVKKCLDMIRPELTFGGHGVQLTLISSTYYTNKQVNIIIKNVGNGTLTELEDLYKGLTVKNFNFGDVKLEAIEGVAVDKFPVPRNITIGSVTGTVEEVKKIIDTARKLLY